MIRRFVRCCDAVMAILLLANTTVLAEDTLLRVATFQVDATPPVGSPLCHGGVPPVATVVDPLSARGIVLFPAGEPIVLCAVDWVGIGNDGHRAWRQALAAAAGTSVERVVVHTLHQHDAPGCDFLAEELLAEVGLSDAMFPVDFSRRTIEAAAAAVREAVKNPRDVSHMGLGRAVVDRVAANRRILGPDGNVKHIRWSFTIDREARDAPEGTIDPHLRLISFWNNDKPLAVLTYYATHPQSFHGKGAVSSDTVGLARALREQELPGVSMIHFNGASGNVTVGKYYEGTRESRTELAGRVADGMRAAWDATERHAITAQDIGWQTEPVMLPVSPRINKESLRLQLSDAKAPVQQRVRAASDLAWLERAARRSPIDVACLRVADAYVLHMPAELFIEYQLAAQQMRPAAFVAMAAYGDYGPGYIGTEISYSQGGYETGVVSHVAPDVEPVLMRAMEKLLK